MNIWSHEVSKLFIPVRLFFKLNFAHHDYLDTDSVALCLDGNLEDLIKEDKKAEWPEAKSKWFVKDMNDAWDLRAPGKMKLEWESSTGAIVA